MIAVPVEVIAVQKTKKDIMESYVNNGTMTVLVATVSLHIQQYIIHKSDIM